MKTIQSTLAIVILVTMVMSCNQKTAVKINENTTSIEIDMTEKIKYPTTRKDLTVVDDYHGTAIPDAFRWLEDDNSEETKDWVIRQNKLTFSYLDDIPFRDKIKDRLTALWDYEKIGSPFKEGAFYYFYKNDGLQNQSVLYRSKEIGGEAELVLDPNKLSDDGTSSLGGLSFNKKGNLVAYSVSEGGSDWRTAYVLDVTTGKLLEDKVEWLKFSGMSWSGDGFYYSRYPSPDGDQELKGENQFHKVYYHKIGTPQSEDELILEDKEHPNRNFYAGVTEDQNFLVVNPVESTSGNAMYIRDLNSKRKGFIKLIETFENDYSLVDSDGRNLLVITNENAPNQKLIQINMDDHAKENWKEIIPESVDLLQGVSIVGNKIFANYIHDASSKIKVYDMKGTFIQDFELPGIGTTGGISGKKSDKEGFFSFSSYTYPSTSFRLNTDDLSYVVYQKSKVKFNPEDYITEQIWFTSKDGTKVPMFATYKKGLIMDGSNPTLLYGYGGFNISLLPQFSLTRIPLLEAGGIYVVANIRGGGEFGSDWHKAGTLERKQNVFDDFQAAATTLIEKKYTSSEKLAIEGGSNGGLLVGACITQRPDLYAVAFAAVGVLDMLRYDKFTIGWAWATDYGLSSEKESFDYLIKYSPLHNVKAVDYPATMVTTADHDDRVVPAHSFKFISELQDKHTGEDPVLIRIETSAGHGAGKPTSKVIAEAADKLAFMLYNMDETF